MKLTNNHYALQYCAEFSKPKGTIQIVWSNSSGFEGTGEQRNRDLSTVLWIETGPCQGAFIMFLTVIIICNIYVQSGLT